jgi:phosphoribosylanthranilate isomerase
MNPVKIKICGITQEKDLITAGVLGADAIGIIVGVPTSPRNISITQAQALLARIPSSLASVLVTVPESVTELQQLYQQVQPDAIQIHGDDLTDISQIRHQAGQYGGTGQTHEWTLSQRLKHLIHPTCVFLAGGLTPENVQTAIRVVEPYAVDVSTGVESRPGIKDTTKMRAFIANVKKMGG